jgi:hypothetical protein
LIYEGGNSSSKFTSPISIKAILPVKIAWGTNRIDVFVRGTDSSVYINNSDNAGTNWNVWGYLGRGATNNTTDVAAVSAVAWGSSRLDVFTREATTVY